MELKRGSVLLDDIADSKPLQGSKGTAIRLGVVRWLPLDAGD